MKTQFDILKNGNVATAVWANKKTKETYPANRNSFGYNAKYILGDWFYNKYGKNMKINQGKSDYRKFYYSAKSMENAGFELITRGEKPLW
jgi:hypothetical protein